ncbi:carbohydrate-selective porin, OprB family [Mariprofundus micogutta]|uniref:Carbohydrate-selective porin, OprB family n=1 Tax=Mariprofundus micogutta TaxID=1921010 RepID=A0A1L8CN27_9PROT|nr:carbohydrate porin [Mariprofundus micogutta]GAV20229.1 carbohydrate-selective porin, OprB family [Mariprofundus micogutta]
MNNRTKGALLAATLLVGSHSSGAGGLGDDGITVELGFTGVAQQISKRNADINKPFTGSLDLVIDADLGFGTLHLYGEGATTADISASSLLSGSNLDAGTAATPNGQGRFQLSEISFGTDIGDVNLNVGVMDLTAFADATSTANDEGVQFLAGVLVNNPTIAFPDYTPALVLNYGEEDATQFTILTANAYGLGDNPNGNYAQLFKFNKTPTGERKGLFTLAELRLPISQGSALLTAGGWHSSMEAARFDATGNDTSAFGAYANLDSMAGNTAWSLRLGFNNAKTDITGGVNSFASLSAEHAINEQHAFGAGLAYSGLLNAYKTSLAPNSGANTTVAEVHYRWQITDEIAISPDIQYHHNANNLATGAPTEVFGNVWAYGLRVQFGTSHQMAHRQ